MLTVECVKVGPIHTNCYLAAYDGHTLIIDPGAEAEKIIKKITELNLKPLAVINTHGHWDHIMADNKIKTKYNIPLYIPAEDQKLIEGQKDSYHIDELAVDLWYKDSLPLDLPLTLISTPGHTPGSTCLLLDNNLFAGDMMFAGGYLGRTDFPGGSDVDIQKSLHKLLKLDDSVLVWPGHDESTSIGQERGFYAGR
ncbi:putative Zn-dependent hydrolases of the beta-lactamase fold [Candidatus Termititenax dinenymphae]|uniref:Zn-dependent hydrolases of the beta-lactamase fold n=1 Tax=Candidatus Termititenax dinenymphae TaxID=2218523 RepID=A0A388TK09_9BACT|nr:putative Zn-dependent hydrolases of the beta-lactamase fold [Candidatus Termititenax dinenymphae]